MRRSVLERLVRVWVLLVLLAALFGFGQGQGIVLAHKGRVVSSTTVAAGPYTLDVLIYASPKVGETVPITIAPSPDTIDGQVLVTRPEIVVTLQPAPGIQASEIRLRVYDDPDQPSFYAVDPVVNVAGIWVLQIEVRGEAGSGTGSTKIAVAGPSGQKSVLTPAPAQSPASGGGFSAAVLVPILTTIGGVLLLGWWFFLRRPAPAPQPQPGARSKAQSGSKSAKARK